MTTTKCRAKNPAACIDPNCPEKRAARNAFFQSVTSDPRSIKARTLLVAAVKDALEGHEEFGMFPYIDVEHLVEQFRTTLNPPKLTEENDPEAEEVVEKYLLIAKKNYESRSQSVKGVTKSTFQYVDIDAMTTELNETLSRGPEKLDKERSAVRIPRRLKSKCGLCGNRAKWEITYTNGWFNSDVMEVCEKDKYVAFS